MKNEEYDLVCVGGGIMSATLAVLCKTVKTPDLNILILERLNDVAKESTCIMEQMQELGTLLFVN